MRAVAAIAFGGCLLLSTVAMAQVPNPFEAYEGSQAADDETEDIDGTVGASDGCQCPEPTAVAPEELSPAFEAGRWNAGLDATFARTSSRNELLDGPEVRETTLFSRLDLSGGYMIRDYLEIGANAGLVGRRVQRGESDAATEALFAVQPLARYHLPVTHRFSAHAHVSAGGFYGRSTREITAIVPDEGPQEFDARTTTRGIIVSGGVGAGYRISEELQVRFGFDATWIWGREQVPSSEESLVTSTNHLGATIGARYFF